MAEPHAEVRELTFRQWLPWTEVFRSFQVAFDFRKMLLAALGIIFMHFGWWLLAAIFQPGSRPTESSYTESAYGTPDDARRALARDRYRFELTGGYKEWPWDAPRGIDNKNPFQVVRDQPELLGEAKFYTGQTPVLLEPFYRFIAPLRALLNPNAGFGTSVFAILVLLWMLAVWAVFGGAITRMAAVQIARRDKISMNEALKFSTNKFMSFFAAPLFPAIGVGVVALLMILVGGILLLIPFLGDMLSGFLFFLPLVGGLVMAILLLGYLGWPLMYATISAEGSDSFDALSRSYAYLFQRPWHYLFYSLLAVLYGVACILVVVFMTSFMVYMAFWALELIPWLWWRATGDPARALFYFAPNSYGWRPMIMGSSELGPDMTWGQTVGAAFVSFWLHIIFLLMIGFAYSYFWSSFTMVYYLLRKKVDDTEMDEVYLEEEADQPYSMPATAEPPPAASAGPTTLPLVTPPPASPAPAAPPAPGPAPSGTDATPPPEEKPPSDNGSQA